ncbi:MAG: hypothetical protein IPN69_18470 [Acidobacteria bacterium]|nr:hypothetical protein [Acidobacteriota bacterium]MBK8812697.1 hypothetical protein [Acidobacteriota bacterium]
MFIVLSIVFVIIGLSLLLTGLRGVVSKKPFVFSSKSSFWFVALAFSPGIIQLLTLFWELYSSSVEHGEDFVEWYFAFLLLFPLLMYPVFFAFLWRQMRGYTVLGVTDDSFRQALYSVLNDLCLPFEESLSKLRLTSLDADLEANVASWMGVANLRVKQDEHQETLVRIADALKTYFANSHASINMVTCIYYIFLGAMLLAMAGIFSYHLASRDLLH